MTLTSVKTFEKSYLQPDHLEAFERLGDLEHYRNAFRNLIKAAWPHDHREVWSKFMLDLNLLEDLYILSDDNLMLASSIAQKELIQSDTRDSEDEAFVNKLSNFKHVYTSYIVYFGSKSTKETFRQVMNHYRIFRFFSRLYESDLYSEFVKPVSQRFENQVYYMDDRIYTEGYTGFGVDFPDVHFNKIIHPASASSFVSERSFLDSVTALTYYGIPYKGFESPYLKKMGDFYEKATFSHLTY